MATTHTAQTRPRIPRPDGPGKPSRLRRFRRLVVGSVLSLPAIAAVAVVASAATLGGLGASGLAAGQTAVSACDGDGFTYDLSVSTGLVTAVVVGDVADPGCEGGTLHLTLVDDAGADIGGGTETVPVDEDTDANLVTVSLSVQPLLTDVAGIHAAVVGP